MRWVTPMKKNFGKKYYDVSENSQCWLSECDLCKDGENGCNSKLKTVEKYSQPSELKATSREIGLTQRFF